MQNGGNPAVIAAVKTQFVSGILPALLRMSRYRNRPGFADLFVYLMGNVGNADWPDSESSVDDEFVVDPGNFNVSDARDSDEASEIGDHGNTEDDKDYDPNGKYVHLFGPCNSFKRCSCIVWHSYLCKPCSMTSMLQMTWYMHACMCVQCIRLCILHTQCL
jgi:hypothetical protein